MPQQRKQKKWQLMLSELKNGDKIVTSGGLRGTIISLKDDALTFARAARQSETRNQPLSRGIGDAGGRRKIVVGR